MSNVDARKKDMGWTPMTRRNACHRCAHAEEDIASVTPLWHCKFGGFKTNALALCDEFSEHDAVIKAEAA